MCAYDFPERCTDIVLLLFISSPCPSSSPAFLCSDSIGLEGRASLSSRCRSGSRSTPDRKVQTPGKPLCDVIKFDKISPSIQLNLILNESSKFIRICAVPLIILYFSSK